MIFYFLLFFFSSKQGTIKGNINALTMGQLNNKSPNLQSTLVQSTMPNTLGVGMNSMPMSIANNGTQPMSTMQGK